MWLKTKKLLSKTVFQFQIDVVVFGNFTKACCGAAVQQMCSEYQFGIIHRFVRNFRHIYPGKIVFQVVVFVYLYTAIQDAAFLPVPYTECRG